MRNWFIRFPTILQACESTIEMLRGQYAHSVGCYEEASFHFIEASKVCHGLVVLNFAIIKHIVRLTANIQIVH